MNAWKSKYKKRNVKVRTNIWLLEINLCHKYSSKAFLGYKIWLKSIFTERHSFQQRDIICGVFSLHSSACRKIQSWKFVSVCDSARGTVTKAILCAQMIYTEPFAQIPKAWTQGVFPPKKKKLWCVMDPFCRQNQ